MLQPLCRLWSRYVGCCKLYVVCYVLCVGCCRFCMCCLRHCVGYCYLRAGYTGPAWAITTFVQDAAISEWSTPDSRPNPNGQIKRRRTKTKSKNWEKDVRWRNKVQDEEKKLRAEKNTKTNEWDKEQELRAEKNSKRPNSNPLKHKKTKKILKKKAQMIPKSPWPDRKIYTPWSMNMWRLDGLRPFE